MQTPTFRGRSCIRTPVKVTFYERAFKRFPSMYISLRLVRSCEWFSIKDMARFPGNLNDPVAVAACLAWTPTCPVNENHLKAHVHWGNVEFFKSSKQHEIPLSCQGRSQINWSIRDKSEITNVQQLERNLCFTLLYWVSQPWLYEIIHFNLSYKDHTMEHAELLPPFFSCFEGFPLLYWGDYFLSVIKSIQLYFTP